MGYEFSLFNQFPGLGVTIIPREGRTKENGSLSLKNHPAPDKVIDLRRDAMRSLAVKAMAVTSLDHGDKIFQATHEHGELYKAPRTDVPVADTLYTTEQELGLLMMVADCGLLVWHVPTKGILALQHAGWKGVQSRIVPSFMSYLKDTYGVAPSDVYIGVLPMICGGCYLIDKQNAEGWMEYARKYSLAPEMFMKESSGDQYTLDLPTLLSLQLQEIGVPGVQQEFMHICTYEQSEEWWSYRRDRDAAGRFGVAVAMKSLRQGRSYA